MRKTVSVLFAVSLVLLGIVLWIFWRQYFLPPEDLVKDFREVDFFVNEFLLERGIDDSSIIEQYQKEVKKGGSLWIESYKKIEYGNKSFPKNFLDPLRKKLKKIKSAFIYEKRRGDKLIATIGKNSRVFHKYVFLPAGSMESKKKVAIVIDDLGYNMTAVDDFMAVGIPMTYAILPGERYTLEMAEYLSRKNEEFILHLPLEPNNYPEANPGKRALLKSMSDKEIKTRFAKLAASIPGIAGVNFHMGSAFSSDEQCMTSLLEAVSQTGLYFLDSHTSQDSKVCAASEKVSYPVLVNNLFLDTERDIESIRKKLELCRKIALRDGVCIAIGHISAEKLPDALSGIKESFKKSGIEFVRLSYLAE